MHQPRVLPQRGHLHYTFGASTADDGTTPALSPQPKLKTVARRAAAVVSVLGTALSGSPVSAADALPATAETAVSASAYLSDILDLTIKAAVQTVVPLGVFGIVVILLFEIIDGKKSRRGDGQEQEEGLLSSVTSSLGKKGTPAQRKRRAAGFNIEVTKLNDRYTAASNVLTSALEGERSAVMAERREKAAKALTSDLVAGLSDTTLTQLAEAANEWSQVDRELEQKLAAKSKQLRLETVKKSGNSTSSGNGFKMPSLGALFSSKSDEYVDLFQEKVLAESEYLERLVEIFPEDKRAAFAEAVAQKDISLLGMASLMAEQNMTTTRPPRVFHLIFKGDVQASGVDALRNEISAVVGYANATLGDEVLLELESPGGTVVGYGLAGAQLERIKAAGLKLTISVGQVAASGGYLMACTADRIVASPFAVLGSIGVITEIPNVYERLTSEGIVVNTVTAGKYKRALTPTKKTEPEDIEKTKADLEDILKLFSGFVKKNRPSLNVSAVATGDTWFGPDALDVGLVDELGTLDDLILAYIQKGCDVVTIKTSAGGSPLNQLLMAEDDVSPRIWAGGAGAARLFASVLHLVADAVGGSSKVGKVQSRDVSNEYLMMSPDETARF